LQGVGKAGIPGFSATALRSASVLYWAFYSCS
jgi:hypothetical protein